MTTTYEVGKTYKDTEGDDVLITFKSTKEDTKFPLLGVIYPNSGYEESSWYSLEGKALESRCNLVVPNITKYLNIYPTGFMSIFDTKDQADKAASIDRIARLKIEYHEGQFDD